MTRASKLDTDKLRKVHRLMKGGATAGERAAARSRAERIATAAGMTLEVALSSLDAPPPQQARSFFDGFEDWMEVKEPGYKAREAVKRAERDARDARRRAEVLAVYGTEAALFARTEREVLLDTAITPLATWDYWTDDDGTQHRFAKALDGSESEFWDVNDITPAIRKAVTNAYPWPATLAGALQELKEWDCLRQDRNLFCGIGEWNHYREVEARYALLKHALRCGQPVASWDDMQARLDWKRYESQWVEGDKPFLDRLEADFSFLRAQASPVQSERRTNAGKRTEVLSMLDAHPEFSDREIARRAGVSPQTVNTWRKRRRATAQKSA